MTRIRPIQHAGLSAALLALLVAACQPGPAGQAITAAAPVEPPAAALPASQPQPTEPPPPERDLDVRLSWLDEFGGRTLVFETESGPVKIRRVGGDSLMLKFGDGVVYVNPWSGAGDYTALPKADQIWVTDPSPEHLDLRAIRQVSTETTQLIVDPESADLMRGLAEIFTLPIGIPIRAGPVRLEALAAYVAEVLPGDIELNLTSSYLASFGSFRMLIAGRAHLLPALDAKGPVDVALMVLDEASALTPAQGAWAAQALDLQAVLPYQYQQGTPAELAGLLQGTGVAVWPLDVPSAGEALPGDFFPNRDPQLADAIALGQAPGMDLEDSLRAGDHPQVPLLYPDLQTLPPVDVRLVHNSYSQTTLLRLTNSVVNTGEGALEMSGTFLTGTGSHQVTQRVYDAEGGYSEVEVGQFVYHPEHSHWHLDGFSLYELWSLDSRGMLDQVLATSGKVSFCLRDIRRSQEPVVAANPAYTSCGATKQGVSAGWIDTYQYYLPGQTIDITGLPNGRYALMSTADPYNLIHEAEEGNNFALSYLSLEDGRVTVLEHPAPVGYNP